MDPADHDQDLATSHLIGRDIEIALLIDHLQHVAMGTGSMVLIRGEGGIGKSRLAREALRRASLMGASVIVGHAMAFDRGLPYALFREMMAGLPTEVPASVADRVDDLLALLDFSTPDVKPASGDRLPRDVLSASTELLVRLAEHRPLVVLWEDLHVADADSVSLFTRLARLVTSSRVLFIGTLRTRTGTDTYELERLGEQFQMDKRGAVIDLEALDRAGTEALIAHFLGVPPDPPIVDLVFESSRGNPFFATEMTRSLVASSMIQIGEDRGRLLEVSGVLRPRTAVVHRFFSAGSNEATVARILSAFGRISLRELPLAASIADVSVDRVSQSFDRLVAEQLLVFADGRYEFTHSILRESLYDDIGPAERRRMHSIIADDLERRRRSGVDVDITELATHVAESADPGDKGAAELLAQAGRATARTAPLVSAGWFAKSADLLPQGSVEHASVIAQQAASLFRASKPRAAARLGIEALERMPTGPSRTRTLSETVISLYICGDLAAALDVIEDEERLVGELGPSLLAQRANFQAQLGHSVDAVSSHATLDPTVGSGELAITMIHDLHRAGLQGRADTVLSLIADLTRLCATAPRETQLAIYSSVALEEAYLFRVAEAVDALAKASQLRLHDRRLSTGGQLETVRAFVAFQQGRWDDALHEISDLSWNLAHNEAWILDGLLRHINCEIHLERGDVRRASEIADAFGPSSEAVRQLTDCSLAKLALAKGDVSGARRGLEAARERIASSGLLFGLAEILDLLIDTCALAGDHDAASTHLAELEDEAARTPWPLGHIRATLARARLMSDGPAAIAAKETAVAAGLPFFVAKSSLFAGACDIDARAHLTSAYRIFDELGALPWRQRAAAELRARRLSAPRPSGDRAAVLTEVESTLARLVSQGLSNRAIARTMHYSVKTVEVYLTRLYAKTGCQSRLELARAVDRHELLITG